MAPPLPVPPPPRPTTTSSFNLQAQVLSHIKRNIRSARPGTAACRACVRECALRSSVRYSAPGAFSLAALLLLLLLLLGSVCDVLGAMYTIQAWSGGLVPGGGVLLSACETHGHRQWFHSSVMHNWNCLPANASWDLGVERTEHGTRGFLERAASDPVACLSLCLFWFSLALVCCALYPCQEACGIVPPQGRASAMWSPRHVGWLDGSQEEHCCTLPGRVGPVI